MQVNLVHVHVKPEHLEAFIEACRLNHQASIQEAGNMRFDILQDAAAPTHFILYEAYAHPDQARAHKDTPHYLAWRDAVADMMVEPRRGEPFTGLFPKGAA